MDNNSELARRLIQAMQARKIGTRKLAFLLDKSPGVISNWRKTGKVSQNIIPICRILNITPQWLLTGQGSIDHPFNASACLSPSERHLIDILRSYSNPIRYAVKSTIMSIGQAL